MKEVLIMSNTIFEMFMNDVNNGYDFVIDFKRKILKSKRRSYIENGKWNTMQNLIHFDNNTEMSDIDFVLSFIESIYEVYKTSYPTEKSERHKKKYFKAIKAEEMSDEELVSGIDRFYMQAMLEAFILCTSLNGDLYWDAERGDMHGWFWQSNKDKDLVILKEWIND